MSDKKGGEGAAVEPAFPVKELCRDCDGQARVHEWPGMTLRQYAAIKLKVPDSGEEWLDGMIRESRRMDYAGAALAGIAANNWSGSHCSDSAWAKDAYNLAAALIKQGEAGNARD